MKRRYSRSLLAREHVIVVSGVVLWIGAAVWQLWVFGNRPEIWVTAIAMGLGAGAIGYYLAIVNRVDSDLQDRQRRRDDRDNPPQPKEQSSD